MARKNLEIERVKLFIAELMNKEQTAHSNLVLDLESQMGNTTECENTVRILLKIYHAKIGVLQKVLAEIRD